LRVIFDLNILYYLIAKINNRAIGLGRLRRQADGWLFLKIQHQISLINAFPEETYTQGNAHKTQTKQ
jgi:hypothetical protein